MVKTWIIGILHLKSFSSQSGIERSTPFFCPIIFQAMLFALLIFASASSWAELPEPAFPTGPIVNATLINPYQVVTDPISFINKTINTPVLMPKKTFMNTVTLISANFLQKVNFSLSVFKKTLAMNDVVFNKTFNASWVNFNDQVNLYNIRFKDSASFFNSIFHKSEIFYHLSSDYELVFQSSVFHKSVKFVHCLFMGDTSFYETTFKENARFWFDKFLSRVDFSYALFKGNVEFDNVSFNGLTNFSHAQFNGNVTFNQSSISGLIDFSYINMSGGEINLTQIDKSDEEKTGIDLTGSAIEKFNFFYPDFYLYFADSVDDSDKILVYKSLLNNFQQRGYTSSYESLFAEFQEFNYLRKGQYITNAIQKHWWYYGLKKEKVFLWIVYFLTFFTMINSFFFVPLVTKYCSVPFLSKVSSDYSVITNPFMRYIYYLPRAFMFTIVLFFGGFLRMGITSKEFISKNILVNIYLMIVVSAGTVCMFYLFKYLFA